MEIPDEGNFDLDEQSFRLLLTSTLNNHNQSLEINKELLDLFIEFTKMDSIANAQTPEFIIRLVKIELSIKDSRTEMRKSEETVGRSIETTVENLEENHLGERRVRWQDLIDDENNKKRVKDLANRTSAEVLTSQDQANQTAVADVIRANSPTESDTEVSDSVGEFNPKNCCVIF